MYISTRTLLIEIIDPDFTILNKVLNLPIFPFWPFTDPQLMHSVIISQQISGKIPSIAFSMVQNFCHIILFFHTCITLSKYIH